MVVMIQNMEQFNKIEEEFKLRKEKSGKEFFGRNNKYDHARVK